MRTSALVVEQHAARRAHPQALFAVGKQRGDLRGTRLVGLLGQCGTVDEVIAVEAVQSVFGAYPQESVGILVDRCYHGARQLVGTIEAIGLCSGPEERQYQQKE